MGEPKPIRRTSRLSVNGSTSIVIEPPAPCGLADCVGELHITIRHNGMRAHLSDRQRLELIVALGGDIR